MVWVLVIPELIAWPKWPIWPFGGGDCQVITWQVRKWTIYTFVVGNMFGEYHSLCTLKTSIVDFGKEKEHCSRYRIQNVWFLLKSPHMPSSPPWPIIEQTIDHKSLTNVCHIKFVSSTPRHSSNRVSILNCGYMHWLTNQIKQTYKRNCCFLFNNKEQIREICEIL